MSAPRVLTWPSSRLSGLPLPLALPRLTTGSPTVTWLESPIGALGQAPGAEKLDQRDVFCAVVSEELRLERLTGADIECVDGVGTRDDVIVGQHNAVRAEDDPRAVADNTLVLDDRVDLHHALLSVCRR